jgi:hypothetical protein
MLVHVVWEFVDSSDEGARQSLAVFQGWTPPPGADFKGFYGFADGDGGVAIVEVDSAATLARCVAPFTPWFRFTARPVHAIEESAAILNESIAFRDSIV